MVRRCSNLMSLIFLSTACVITVLEYKNAKRNDVKFAQYEIPSSVKEMNIQGDELVQDAEIAQDDQPGLQLVKSAENAAVQSRTIQVSKGDTLASLLTNAGLSAQDVEIVSASVQKHLKNKKLKAGQTFVVNYRQANDGVPIDLVDLEYVFQDGKVIIVRKNEQGDCQSVVESFSLQPLLKRASGKIHSSFYATAIQSGVPAKIVKEAISSLAYVMNFQHGIKRGDSFEILYEEQIDRYGKAAKVGNIKYIGFMAGSTYHRLYRVVRNGAPQFFDAKGMSVVCGLLQTPIDPRKMRITSGFCKNRLHPINGYRRDHKGVDFGAPTGTEIKAAGDGVVTKLGYYGEYGNFVKIKHTSGFETAYGHLSKYAKNLKVGSKVAQNQLIGYVGSTGNATGPHLHFEVIHKGSHVNPMGVKAMPAVKLVGKDLNKFYAEKRTLDSHIVGLTPNSSTLSTNVG